MQPLLKPRILALLLLVPTLPACADRRAEGWDTGRGLSDVAYFTDWNTDGDTYLSEGEFEAAFAGNDWYVRGLHGIWDADDDGRLSEGEWTGGLYDEWDLDDDGLEWGEFDVEYLD